MLGFLYTVGFILQVFLLIRNCRARRGLGKVLIGNILSIAVSCFLLRYFDTLPGDGMMPGLAYFSEVFCSLCAIAVFAVLTLVTFLLWLYQRKH